MEMILRTKKTPISFEQNTITIKTEDIDQEKSLWIKLLGMEKTNEKRISFSSILPNRNFDLIFTSVKNNIPYTLDTEGPTCIALITNNIDKMILSMNGMGLYKFIGPWESKVNNKKLIIAMFKTIGGIIVELIQVERKL